MKVLYSPIYQKHSFILGTPATIFNNSSIVLLIEREEGLVVLRIRVLRISSFKN